MFQKGDIEWQSYHQMLELLPSLMCWSPMNTRALLAPRNQGTFSSHTHLKLRALVLLVILYEKD